MIDFILKRSSKTKGNSSEGINEKQNDFAHQGYITLIMQEKERLTQISGLKILSHII